MAGVRVTSRNSSPSIYEAGRSQPSDAFSRRVSRPLEGSLTAAAERCKIRVGVSKINEWADTVSVPPDDINSTEPTELQAYLVVVRGSNVGETFPVISPAMVVGRGVGADLRINDDSVSRVHCRFEKPDRETTVQDLSSRNGTFVNGERVSDLPRKLVEGDRLQIGTTFVLRFTYTEGDSGRISNPVVQGTTTDPLTGAYSRRHFMEVLEREVNEALAREASLSLLLIHIDRYSELAATHGQHEVDEITNRVAAAIRGGIHDRDALGRIAGGDFALLVNRASPGDTVMLANRLRESTRTTAADVTLSLGVAAIDELRIDTAHDLLIAASTALHRARSRGGNRVVLCTPELLREPKSQVTV